MAEVPKTVEERVAALEAQLADLAKLPVLRRALGPKSEKK